MDDEARRIDTEMDKIARDVLGDLRGFGYIQQDEAVLNIIRMNLMLAFALGKDATE